MAAINPVSVHRLRLHGDSRHKDALLASLDETAWPAADSRQYLLLRRLRVQATWWQAAEMAGQDARTLAAGAVSGWSAAAAGALAVRFEDLSDLLACLSHDLVHGRAGGLWYWHNWQGFVTANPADAITRLWCEHATQLPDVMAVLTSHQALAPVCLMLDGQQIAQLLDSVRRVTGWPLPDITPAELATAVPVPSCWPRAVLNDWLPAMQAMPAAQQRRLLPLIALTSGWTQIPHALHDRGHWLSWYGAVAGQLSATVSTQPLHQTPALAEPATEPQHDGGHPPAVTDKAPDVSTPEPTDAAAAPVTRARRPASRNRADMPDGGTSATAPAAATASRLADEQPAHRQTRSAEAHPGIEPIKERTPTSDALHDPAATTSPTPTSASNSDNAPMPEISMAPAQDLTVGTDIARFHTAQGGLFYLLNVLAHPAIASCLQDAQEPGWHRLYRLGRHLGLDCDPPLARFLSHRLNLTDPAQLDELPALANETQLCQLADRHYAHLAPWGRTLLAVPAEVQHSRSHLDIYYPLASVRLDVRRVGLDIDPGWLPWLGQVVHFHYRDPLAPEGDMP